MFLQRKGKVCYTTLIKHNTMMLVQEGSAPWPGIDDWTDVRPEEIILCKRQIHVLHSGLVSSEYGCYVLMGCFQVGRIIDERGARYFQ